MNHHRITYEHNEPVLATVSQSDHHVDAYDRHVVVMAIRAAKRAKDNKRRSYLKACIPYGGVTMRQLRRGIIAGELAWRSLVRL